MMCLLATAIDRRITLELRERGHVINHKRVARVMRENDLHAHHRRRFKPVAGSESNLAVFPNRYRNIIPAEPDRVWVADISYIRFASGFIYLAVVLCACSRKVIGYAISKRIDTPLALTALTTAYNSRKPPPGTCIHHTDRGCLFGCLPGRHGFPAALNPLAETKTANNVAPAIAAFPARSAAGLRPSRAPERKYSAAVRFSPPG